MTSRSEEELSSLVVQGWMNVWGEFCELFNVGDVNCSVLRPHSVYTNYKSTKSVRRGVAISVSFGVMA